MKKFILTFAWIGITLIGTFSLLGYYSFNSSFFNQSSQKTFTRFSLDKMPQNLYTALPNILGASEVNKTYLHTQDIIPELVGNYMIKYHSPMKNSSDELVKIARKYGIDPLLMVSIAQCESNLGKKMPYKSQDDLLECHNPFGWGIHKSGTLCFDTWEEGYEAVAKGLRENYANNGLTNPDEMMRVYTPPALEKNGSWAKCVNQFMNELNKQKEELSYNNTIDNE